MKNFEFLKNFLEKKNESKLIEIIGPVIIGPIRANHPLFVRLELNVNSILNKKFKTLVAHRLKGTPYPLFWTEILSHQMNKIMPNLVKNNQTNYFCVNGRNFYAQLHQIGLLGDLFNLYDGSKYENLLQKFNFSLPLAVYHNNQVEKKLKFIPLQKFQRMDSIFMRLFNVSKQKCLSKSAQILV